MGEDVALLPSRRMYLPAKGHRWRIRSIASSITAAILRTSMNAVIYKHVAHIPLLLICIKVVVYLSSLDRNGMTACIDEHGRDSHIFCALAIQRVCGCL